MLGIFILGGTPMHPALHELAVLVGRVLAERRHGKTNVKSAYSSNDNVNRAKKTSKAIAPANEK
jgi:hypothetical protein